MTTEDQKPRRGRRKNPLPAGVALPPRHQEFGGAELMSRFVSAANGEAYVNIPEDSPTLCTWRCSAGHEYQETRAAHRHSRGCPTCATSVATRMPGLLKYWDTRQNKESPADVSAYSRERYSWVCEHGHRFERPPYRVLATGHQCKACRQAGLTPWRIAGKRDDSSTLAEEFPAIAAEWDKELNSRGPEEFASGSQRVVFWRCENGHSWSSPICHRTSPARRPATCQQCKAIAFAAPELAAQLHPTLNPPDIAYEVRKSSSQVLFWQCDRGHIFSASVAARLRSSYPAGCDTCRSIAVKAPDLIEACWAYELNGQLDPEVLKTSSTQEVWWVRVDSLDVRPGKRQAEHFERKRIGYRYRCYLNDRNGEVARIAAYLKDRQRVVRTKQTLKTKAGRGS
jgi:hypothetical protein